MQTCLQVCMLGQDIQQHIRNEGTVRPPSSTRKKENHASDLGGEQAAEENEKERGERGARMTQSGSFISSLPGQAFLIYLSVRVSEGVSE
mmetsp:Transcript_34362/g.67936  ORF Transcript_34362/g.67936 Transcript_34362/m.67936 type:complete len:90 (+) Transcript_34362:1307-1576(+)